MKKMLSNKLQGVLWILKAILFVILSIAAHVYLTGEGMLSGIVILACMYFFCVCIYSAFKRFKRIEEVHN